MDLRRSLALPIAALSIGAAAVSGCSSSDTVDRPPPPTVHHADRPHHRLDFDPERYVRRYEESAGESYGSAPTGAASPGPNQAGEAGAPPVSAPPLVPTIDQGNTFVDHGDHGFTTVADEPRSSFGLDVDTGSVTVGRAFLAEGIRPPAASVRTEEWVNALGSDQTDPGPADIGVRVDGSLVPLKADGTRVLRIGVAGRDIAESERPAAHLTFVVDTSGSMDIRNRLGLVQSSLALLVDQLRNDDTISIVTFSDEAGVLLEPTPVHDADRIVAAIDDLRPGNSTNLEAGLRTGYEQAHRAFDPEGTNAVILASDGVANVGLTDPNGLAGTIQRRAQEGVHLVTVGYGMGNFNDDLMEQVADRGDGFYAYLDTYAQAERFFRDRLTSTLSVVAQDAKAQVTFDPALVSSYRLVGYEDRGLTAAQFDDTTTDAGEIGAGHRATALYEVRLVADGGDDRTAPPVAIRPPSGEESTSTSTTEGPPINRANPTIGSVAVNYRSSASKATVTLRQPITMSDVNGSFDDADPGLRLAAGTAAFAQWLRSSPAAGEVSLDRAGIRSVVATAAESLPAGGLPGSVLTPPELLRLIDQAATTKQSPPNIAD